MELVEELRPELHRYCARMTGSVFDGEDVLQETFAKAYYALGQMREPPNLKPWLFRIAHNTALDFLRRYERSNVELVPDVPERAQAQNDGVDPSLVEAALTVFVELRRPSSAARSSSRTCSDTRWKRRRRRSASPPAPSRRRCFARAPTSCVRRARPRRSRLAPPQTAHDQAALRQYVDLVQRARLGRAAVASRRRSARRSRVARPAADAASGVLRSKLCPGSSEKKTSARRWGPSTASRRLRYSGSVLECRARVLHLARGGRTACVSLVRDFRYIPYIAEGATFLTFAVEMHAWSPILVRSGRSGCALTHFILA